MTSLENLLYSTSFQLLFLQFVLSDHACKLGFFVSRVRKQRTQVTNLKSNKFVFRNNQRNVLCALRCFLAKSLFIYLFIHYSNLAYNTRNSIMNVNLAETLCLGMSLRNKTAVRLLWGINCKPGHLAGFDIDHARKQWQLFCEKSIKMDRNWPRPANYNIFSCFSVSVGGFCCSSVFVCFTKPKCIYRCEFFKVKRGYYLVTLSR